MSQYVGVVLAGGVGTRLGRAKGELEIEGRRLAERAAALLWPICGSVLISIAPGRPNPAPTYPAVEDAPPRGRGPLAGIHAAMEATRDCGLLVVACDYPRVGGDLLRRLLASASEEYDLVMPTDGRGRDHPLVALWSRTTEPYLRDALARRQYKVRALLAEWRVRRLSPRELGGIDPDRALLNLNWPADLEAL